jgi:hypothetical protein
VNIVVAECSVDGVVIDLTLPLLAIGANSDAAVVSAVDILLAVECVLKAFDDDDGISIDEEYILKASYKWKEKCLLKCV